jgi:hypothetical protein
MATSAVNQVKGFTDDLEAFLTELDVTPVNTEVDFDVPDDLLAQINLPAQPTAPDMSFTMPALGYNPDISTTIEYVRPEAPTDNLTSPSINYPAVPEALTAEAPTDVPSITDVNIPDAPNIVLPAEPTLAGIDLPDPPNDLAIPAWDGVMPEIDFNAPVGEILWDETAYTSALLDELKAKIREWMQGGTGIPDPIWDQIWARVTKGNQQLAKRAEQEATEEWAGRGFFAPVGALNAALRRARQEALNLDSEKLREIAIESAKMEVENLRFSITTGMQLESALLQAWNQMQERELKAAIATIEAAISVFNAKVQLFNARVQGYSAKAEVFKTLIQASTLYLEKYKVELEGQKIISEINQQQVQMYVARLEATTKAIEVYKAQLEGVRTQVEVDKNRIESFRALIQAYSEQVQAKKLEYDGYQAQLQGELIKSQIYQSDVNAYSARMNAYSYQVQAENSNLEAQVKMKDLEIKKLGAFLEKYKAEIQAQVSQIQGRAQAYGAQADMFRATAEVEKTKATVNDKRYELFIEEGKAKAELELKKADLNIQQVLRMLALEQDALKTLMHTHAQLAASAMSAVNLSASIGESAANSVSNNCSVSY